MRAFFGLATGLCLVASTYVIQAAEIGGRYDVVGSNPGNQGQYRGEVVIEPQGETYRITWTIGSDRTEGTGIFRDGRLAVVYQPDNARPGVAFYDLRGDGSLSGTWVVHGGAKLGAEVWQKPGA